MLSNTGNFLLFLNENPEIPEIPGNSGKPKNFQKKFIYQKKN